MTRQQRIVSIVLGLLVFYAALWTASEWWEKALAKPYGTASISPDGCFQAQTFRPFWVLPGFLHPQTPPDDAMERSWFVSWESPAFFRLYDLRNGRVLGESEIYDLVAYGGPLDWAYGNDHTVSAAMIHIGTTPDDCTASRTP
jgi:hypothetical protein